MFVPWLQYYNMCEKA